MVNVDHEIFTKAYEGSDPEALHKVAVEYLNSVRITYPSKQEPALPDSSATYLKLAKENNRV